MVMSFENQTALNHLLQHGSIYTFRVNRHKKIGYDWINDGRGRHKIANVTITFIKDVKDIFDLEAYAYNSGFFSLRGWEQAIADRGIKNIKGFLYRVSLRDLLKLGFIKRA